MFEKYRIARYGRKYVIAKRFFLFWCRGLECRIEREVDEYQEGRYAGGWTLFEGKGYMTFSTLAEARKELKRLRLGQKPIRSVTYRGKQITFIDR